ncbi:MAG: ATP-binding cassette domain-containing protein [Bacteroidales bacterium]|jgi:ABC-2 type transport system ATP-binding protein|nr:ATP-binding cassette domain-containing protein [Bacteroidales bacterium]
MNFIDISHIHKQFANHHALKDVSFSIEKGVVFGLLGPNGAGKTTLIRILNQITAPDSGEVLFEGRPLQRSDIQRIGYLPEERGLYKKMEVGEQALYLAQLKGLEKADAEQKLHYWFNKFDINNWWNRKVEELSKGMQQKIQFITTIIHEPEFLIFDEPFSGFDPINTNLLKDEILELKQRGTTIILSTHNMASVEEICDRIVLIDNGRNILEGNILDIKKQFKDNIFELEIEDSADTFGSQHPAGITILSQKRQHTHLHCTIKLQDSLTIKEFLHYCIEKYELHSFKEILPSMNDIFINQVKNNTFEDHE